jgi:hypothetical protein
MLEVEKLWSGFKMVKRWPTIQKPDFLYGFPMVLTKWLPFTIRKPDTTSVQKMTI